MLQSLFNKKRPEHRYLFSYEYWENFKNSFIIEHLRWLLFIIYWEPLLFKFQIKKCVLLIEMMMKFSNSQSKLQLNSLFKFTNYLLRRNTSNISFLQFVNAFLYGIWWATPKVDVRLKFCQIKIFPSLVRKTPSFVCLVFKIGSKWISKLQNLLSSKAGWFKNKLYQAVTFRI